MSNLSSCTLAAWVKLDATNAWSRIWDFGSGTTNYMLLTPRCGGGNVLRFALTTGGSGGEQRIDAAFPLATGVWTHVAVTLFGNVGILYVDGVEAGRNNALTLKPANLGGGAQNWIGRSQWAADPYLDGAVDDFRIYIGAMTATEVWALAHPPLAPAAPSDLAAAPLSETQFRLSWLDQADNETKYVVARSRSGSNSWTILANNLPPNTTNGLDSGLTPLTAYDYRVHAENAMGASEYAWLSNAVTPAGVGDGIPGSWRYQHFGNGLVTDALTCATCDYDGDGQVNYDEYVASTIPTNPASFFAVAGIAASNTQQITWYSVPGKLYELRWDGSPAGSWSAPIILTGKAAAALTSYTDTNPAATRIYRLGIKP